MPSPTYCQLVEEVPRIIVRPVVESEGDVAINHTIVYADPSVRNPARLRPCNFRRIDPAGLLVAITTAAVVQLAVRGGAIVLAQAIPPGTNQPFPARVFHKGSMGGHSWDGFSTLTLPPNSSSRWRKNRGPNHISRSCFVACGGRRALPHCQRPRLVERRAVSSDSIPPCWRTRPELWVQTKPFGPQGLSVLRDQATRGQREDWRKPPGEQFWTKAWSSAHCDTRRAKPTTLVEHTE